MKSFIVKLRRWLRRRTPYHHMFRDAKSRIVAGYYDTALRYWRNSALPGYRKLFPVNLTELDRPLWIRLGSSDFTSVEEVFLRRNYHLVKEYLPQSPRAVIDLGANAGVTVRLWQHLWPEARIVAVEPDGGNMDVCRKNAEEGGRAQNVSLIQAGISARSGALGLRRNTYELGFQVTETPADGDEMVEGITMLELLETQGLGDGVTLLKCDIEGSEVGLFADCAAWINRVEHLLIELHGGYSIDDLILAMERNGGSFEVLRVSEDLGTKVHFLRAKNFAR